MSGAKTKIIATYGPAIEHGGVLEKAAMHADIFRINFSHGSLAEWNAAIDNIRDAAALQGKDIAILADLPGPKLRLSRIGEGIDVKKGEVVRFRYGRERSGYIPLEQDIRRYLGKGSVIVLGDGYMSFVVTGFGDGIEARAINSGKVMGRKGINIRKGHVTAAPPTSEDIKLALFAKKRSLDYIGISFVRSADNISKLRKAVGGAFIVAKIERAEAIRNIGEIAMEADALMVARGDLAFEVPVETIPVLQSKIIRAGNAALKPVIVATQMLASMVNSPMPTRAEVNDIATAVTSGADCVMLSEETAVGKYPIESLKVLAATAASAESIAIGRNDFKIRGISDSIAFAAAEIADNYRTECIFAPTQTGSTAKKLSALRPRSRIIALSRYDSVRRMLSLYWGVRSRRIDKYDTVDRMLNKVKEIASREGMKRYIVVSGSPNRAGTTNTLKYMD